MMSRLHSVLEPLLRFWRSGVVGLALLSLLGCDLAKPEPAPLVEGRAFPAFMFDLIAKGGNAAPPLDGKMLVLNIWATWCPPCRREMPALERLSKMLDPERFAVIGLSTDADALLATEFLLQNGITFANFFDKDGKETRQLGLKAYPETFVIAPDRTLLRRMTGLHDWSSPEMVRLLEGLHPGRSTGNAGQTNAVQ